jgi:hypothetical protein
MNICSLRSSNFVYIPLLLFLGIGTSCDTNPESTQGSHYQVVGTSKLTVFIDSVVADRATIDNVLYMELMTEKDTFLVKPINQELSFPKLEDSLTRVRVYYNDWYFQIQGELLRDEYQALYFPNQDATILIDTYPFEHPTAKSWLKQQKERVYYEIRLQNDGRFFLTSMAQDKWSAN